MIENHYESYKCRVNSKFLVEFESIHQNFFVKSFLDRTIRQRKTFNKENLIKGCKQKPDSYNHKTFLSTLQNISYKNNF